MKIFLTGGRGMVGSNLLEHQEAKNYKIYAPTSEELDLLDYSLILKTMEEFNPDIVIHAAGRVGGIQANIKDPASFLTDNINMGLNLVGAADALGIKKLLNLGSSCMYSRKIENPIPEDSILKGELEPTNEGYALAKIVIARYCDYISRNSVDKNYKTIIPCNLYGRHDKYDTSTSHMIPAVIRKLYEAKLMGVDVVKVWGDGTARREFMFAEDLADFIYFALHKFSAMPQYLNVGIGRDYTVQQYYEEIAKVVNYSGRFENDLSKPKGMQKKLVDISLLKKLGWESKTSLQKGLHQAFEFYKGTL